MGIILLFEVLHVENCPHLPQTLESLKEALSELNIKQMINEVVIEDQDDAERVKFLGSTSIRIDGDDIAPFETDQYVLT